DRTPDGPPVDDGAPTGPPEGRRSRPPAPLDDRRHERRRSEPARPPDASRRAPVNRRPGQRRAATVSSDGTFSTAPSWVPDAVFYQVFPDRFARSDRLAPPGPFEEWDSPPTLHGFKGGDLFGVAEHLDYLADLGITALYLNPIFSSASNHRYHTFDYFEVDPLLGGDTAFDELLVAAHGRGM